MADSVGASVMANVFLIVAESNASEMDKRAIAERIWDNVFSTVDCTWQQLEIGYTLRALGLVRKNFNGTWVARGEDGFLDPHWT